MRRRCALLLRKASRLAAYFLDACDHGFGLQNKVLLTQKMVSRIPSKVSAFENTLSRLKTMVSGSENMVGSDRRCKICYFYNLSLDKEHGRKDGEHVLVACDLNLGVKALGAGDAEDGRKHSAYVFHDLENGPRVQEYLFVREEHGLWNKEPLLQNAGHLLYV
jgi:hypothetical protein